MISDTYLSRAIINRTGLKDLDANPRVRNREYDFASLVKNKLLLVLFSRVFVFQIFVCK